MSRKSTLELTAEEQSYLKTFLDRAAFAVKRLPEKQQNSKEAQATASLAASVSDEMQLTRVELRVLEKAIQGFMDITRVMTLPEYDRRIHENPATAERYKPYIEKHEAELDLCETLIDKVRAAL